jgi:hypothetical protein
MAYNPLNLAFRFVLELLALSAFAFWGWAWGGWQGWILAAGCVLLAMAVWAIFRTPGDRSSGKGYVTTPGALRLVLELAFFGLAVAALLTAHANDRAEQFAILLGAGVVVHYALSWDRVHWLLRN